MFNRPVSFVVAGAASAATLTAASAPSPLYPVYQRLWGFSAFTLTVIFAVYVLALLAALLTVGSLSDRVGRRPVASGALVLLALGMLLFVTAEGPGGLIAARVVQGLAVGAATSTTTAMIMDWAPNPRFGSILSSAVPSLGIAIGAVLAGALVQFAPHPRQLVFWILAVVYLVIAALIWLVPERPRLESISRESIWRSLLPSAGLPPHTRPVFFALLPAIGATWALAGLYLSLGSSIIGTVLGVHSHFRGHRARSVLRRGNVRHRCLGSSAAPTARVVWVWSSHPWRRGHDRGDADECLAALRGRIGDRGPGLRRGIPVRRQRTR